MNKMRRSLIVTTVLISLIAANILHNTMLSLYGLPAAEIRQWRIGIWVGVYCSQPALLAVWAAFGIIGRRFEWHVSALKSRHPTPNQFSVLTLLTWMALAAVLFSVFGWIVRNSIEMDVTSIKYWKQFTQVLIKGLVIGALSIPTVLNVALVLRDRFAIRDLIWFSIVVVGQIAASYCLAISVRFPIYETLTQIGLVLLAFNCTLFATLWIVRLLGFRLLQQSDSLTPPQQAC